MTATTFALPVPEATARESKATQSEIDIPPLLLPEALTRLSRQTGTSIGSTQRLPHVPVNALRGTLTVEAALQRLLVGTGLIARQVGQTAWRVEREAIRAPAKPQVLVTRQVQLPPATEMGLADTIIVTATKQAQRLRDIPRSIAIARTGHLGQARAEAGTLAVSAQIDGLSLTALGPGRNRMFLRGVADSPFNGASASTVAVLLDDTRLTFSAPDPDLRLVDIDRVEVLKGPQGSLYGVGALGGIYRAVTNRAKIDDTSADLSTSVLLNAHKGTGISGSAVVNLPLVPARAAVRLSGYAISEPGWIDTGMRKNANSTTVIGARAGLGMEIDGDWRLDLTGQIQLLNNSDSQYVFAQSTTNRPDQQAEPHDNDLRHVAARVSGKIGTLDVLAVSGMTWHAVNDVLDASVGAESFGITGPALFRDDRHYRVWDSEVRLNGAFGATTWLVGFSHLESNDNRSQTFTQVSRPDVMVDKGQRTSAETALFGLATVPLGKGVSIEAGARLFRGVVADVRTAPAPSDARLELRRIGVTPSLAVVWKPHDGRQLYVRYGSAFRQGGLTTNAAGISHPLSGDELATFEACWREDLAEKASFNVSVFYTRWDDIQSDVVLTNGLIETRNAGKARIVGVEGTLEVALGERLAWQLGATLQDARLLRNDLGVSLDDQRLPVVPRYTLRSSLDHTFSGAILPIGVRLSVNYLGPSRLSFDPALDQPMGGIFETAVEGWVSWHRAQLTLGVDNLVGGTRDTFAFGNLFRISQGRQYTPQQPLRMRLTVNRAF